MNAIYTKMNEPIKRNCYEFLFTFEHGDADSREEYLKVCQGMTEAQMLSYYQKSQEISEQIDNARSNGKTLSNDFEDNAKCEGFNIPVELDNYAKMHMSGYYAASGILEVFYYDNQGEKFKVTIQE